MARQVWQLVLVDPNAFSGSIVGVDSGDIRATGGGFSRLQSSSSMVFLARCFANKPWFCCVLLVLLLCVEVSIAIGSRLQLRLICALEELVRSMVFDVVINRIIQALC